MTLPVWLTSSRIWQWLWALKCWRWVNPVHVVLGLPVAPIFVWIGARLHGSFAASFVLAFLALWLIGFAHEQGDGDFTKGPTAPWEGIKDMYSFPAAALLWLLVHAAR